ncbi:Uncharacterized NAD(P)/FAD-binding protein YdhS [Enhydrobacter aerosaccus]|uniref:Uncharacterized NAD(P)/FAD-binding protein YdhS n=1 Tax=Enhydrobacter aerosaccus TaxID=225324 RepID=A0A1T4RWD5_9HYPH|nr:FAD/NAD(P)-binding protein [Enhydrobacter aerosaccus]SKA20186.1 Uncharacterized NAD(P)/FAD-binding protein YdhS [Enhydrobacter aerosaccus]
MSAGIRSIGIIGAGFTGTMLAANLLGASRSPLEILLFDRAGAFGRGTAYSTPNAKHLLNVRVANMSAYEHDPHHFLRWLWSKDDDGLIPPSGHAFVSRGRYGTYLQETMEEASRKEPGSIVSRISAEVTNLTRDGSGITLHQSDGVTRGVDCAVLCIGNFPPALPLPGAMIDRAGDRYIANPWDWRRMESVGRNDPVLLVGTGLTMVDSALDLVCRGHVGPMTAISRRGLQPNPHKEVMAYKPFLDPANLPHRTLELLRLVRREVRIAQEAGFDWRSVVDAMRPQTQALWRALPLGEQRRFLRHPRPYWEVHRHRLAPTVDADLQALRQEGTLSLVAGRIRDIEVRGDRLAVTYRRRRDGELQTVEAAWIVNCSGPELDYSRIEEPLIKSLFKNGLARPDALALGLDVSAGYELISAAGAPLPSLFALGPPIRGALWETTAVPDVRKQCSALARHIVDDMLLASASEPVLGAT